MTPTIPVLDVADAFAGTGVDATARLLDDALSTIGFVQIVGHGIAPDVFTAAYDQMNLLLAKPAEVLDTLRDPTGHPFYGLTFRTNDQIAGGERVVYHQFELNHHPSPEAAAEAGVPAEYLSHFRNNLWPADMPEFRAAQQGCFDAMRDVAPRLLALCAVALGMPSDFFVEHMRLESTSYGTGAYPHHDWIEPGTMVLPWHTDRETILNMLHQRGTYAGLQVRNRDGVEISVPVVPEALVVNVGELLERWSSNRWYATPHRVVSGVEGEWRQSIVTFCAPDVTRPILPLLAEGGAVDPLGTPFSVFELAMDLPQPVAP